MTGYDYTRQIKDKIAESPTHTLSLRDALDYINFYGLKNLFNATGDMRFVGQVAIDVLDKTLSESKCNIVSDIEPLPYQSKPEPLKIDEAISHCLEVVERNKKNAVDSWYSEGIFDSCAQCAEDHQQLAEWLTELKEWKANPFSLIKTECKNNYYCNKCAFLDHCPFSNGNRVAAEYPMDWVVY